MKVRRATWIVPFFLSPCFFVPYTYGQFVLTTSTPSGISLAVPTNQVVNIEFSEPVDPLTAAGAVSIRSNVRSSVPGVMEVTNNTISFQAQPPFIRGESITIDINSTLRSVGGAPLAKPFGFEFTVALNSMSPPPPYFKDIHIFSVSSSLHASTFGDFDSDGDMDVLYGGNSQMGWLENTGDATTWITHEIVPFTPVVYAMRLVDIDNDLDNDIITSNMLGGAIVLYTNDGDQNLTRTHLTAESQSLSHDVADFDGNGYLDIVFSDLTTAGKGTYVLYNHGLSGFTKTKILIASAYLNFTRDLDNDGDWDIIQSDGTEIRYLLNDGATFIPTVIDTYPLAGFDMLVEDFDGDGDFDLVTNHSGLFWFYRNNGSMIFAKETFGSGSDFAHLASGDFDGDSDVDVMCTGYPYKLMENDGTGNFTLRGNLISAPAAGDILAGDVNQDGHLDFFGQGGNNGLLWFKNTTLEEAFPFTGVPTSIVQLMSNDSDLGDYDQDGDFDLITTGFEGNTPRTFLYINQDGVFEKSLQEFVGVGMGSCDWGDFDRDGDLDILIMGASVISVQPPLSTTAVYVNDGGTFTRLDIGSSLPGAYHGEARWADFDNDGWLDIAICANFHSALFRSTGLGTFERKFGWVEVFTHGDVETADFDNDGDLDFATSGWRGNDDLGAMLKVYRNNGDWNFSEMPGQPLQGLIGGDLIWCDVDNNGLMDIVAAGAWRSNGMSLPNLTVHINQGSSFQSIRNAEFMYRPDAEGSAAAGDFNNDGISDVAVSSFYGDEKLFVLRNNGLGDLANAGAELPPTPSRQCSWADVDLDDDIDLLVGSMLFRNNTILKNTRPTPPTILQDSVYDNMLYMSWNAGNDAETSAQGLSYEVYVGNESLEQDILPAHANTTTGQRKLATTGIAKGRNWHVSIPETGTYYYGVQSIDPSFEGSVFSTEAQVNIHKIDGLKSTCAGDEYTYTVGQSGTYQWVVPTGTVVFGQGTDSIQVQWQQSGTHYIQLWLNALKKNTLIVQTHVKPDKPVFELDGSKLITSADESAYQWYIDGIAVSAEENGNKPHLPLTSHRAIYELEVTNEHGCTNRSDPNLITGLETEPGFDVVIYPNPTHRQVELTVKEGTPGFLSVSIYDLLGNQVGKHELMKTGEVMRHTIDISNLATGVYLVRVQSQSETYVTKICKL